MEMADKHGLKGQLTIIARDLSGAIVDYRKIDNLITTGGRRLLAQYFTGLVFGKPKLLIAVGDQDDTPVELDDKLKNQLDEQPVKEPEIKKDTDEQGRVSVLISATLPVTQIKEEQGLKEAGILIQTPDGDFVLYNRTTFPVVTRTGNMELTLTWELFF